MKELNLPEYSFSITGKEGREMIFDRIRKKYVKLTPEEWVRQNFIQYLVKEGKYPPGLIGVEVMSAYNDLRKRVDILVHDRSGRPVMIVECKSPDTSLNDKAFGQVADYNVGFRVPYLIVTNGVIHYACRIDIETGRYEYLDVIPLYEDIIKEG